LSYELLVEVRRNGIIESRHVGAAVVCNYKGVIEESWGEHNNLIFPRSALKPILAIPLIESGACDKYALSDEEIALACSSHQGELIHLECIKSWLARIGLSEEYLACGAELPLDLNSAQTLLASGKNSSKLHHNCSGKHASFLTTALRLNMSLDNYHQMEHPLQQLSLDTISDMAGVNIRQFPTGVDGCGLPAPTMSLRTLALATARFANPVDLSEARANAIYRLQAAIINHPLYLAGNNTFVSEIISATRGAIIAKTGAEGVVVAALPKDGLGVAVKIADGSSRARPVALMALLHFLGVLSEKEKKLLQKHFTPKLYNSRESIIGEIRPAASWLP